MKNIEKTGGGPTMMSYGLETTVSTVQPTVSAKDSPQGETANGNI